MNRFLWALAVSATLLPFLAAATVGALVGAGGPVGTAETGLTVFHHNLRLGLGMVIGGWFTLGLFPLAVTTVSSLATGYAVGTHLSYTGGVETLSLLPHFIPEMGAYVVFVYAGLSTARVAAQWAVRAPGPTALPDIVPSTILWTSVAGLLTALAAVIEQTAF